MSHPDSYSTPWDSAHPAITRALIPLTTTPPGGPLLCPGCGYLDTAPRRGATVCGWDPTAPVLHSGGFPIRGAARIDDMAPREMCCGHCRLRWRLEPTETRDRWLISVYLYRWTPRGVDDQAFSSVPPSAEAILTDAPPRTEGGR